MNLLGWWNNLTCHVVVTLGISGFACRGVALALLVVFSCWVMGWGGCGRGWVRSDMFDGFLC